jgi:UDP-N-acetylglucosamine 2-epimerase (non-hydrolysing)
LAVKVLVVIGTRPEAIKLAPLIHTLRGDPFFKVTTCVTSQHKDLLAPMLTFFGIKPAFDLQVMSPGQTLGDVTIKVLAGIADILKRDVYDLIVVQGDTTTAFAAGLAAFYAHVPIAHVEAGLRSGNLEQPFPEEANRCLVDVLAAYFFPPTQQAKANLLKEGRDTTRIFVTGNTGIDALLLARDLLRRESARLPVELGEDARLLLVTAHRRESFGAGMERICQALLELSTMHAQLHVLFPVHPNPNVTEVVHRRLGGRDRIHLTAPLEYPEFVQALLAADVILSDSGGVQEEAPALGKRVLVLRETTERPEGIMTGAAELVGTDRERIVSRVTAALSALGKERPVVNPYGDGRASQRIAEVLKTGALALPFKLAA